MSVSSMNDELLSQFGTVVNITVTEGTNDGMW